MIKQLKQDITGNAGLKIDEYNEYLIINYKYFAMSIDVDEIDSYEIMGEYLFLNLENGMNISINLSTKKITIV